MAKKCPRKGLQILPNIQKEGVRGGSKVVLNNVNEYLGGKHHFLPPGKTLFIQPGTCLTMCLAIRKVLLLNNNDSFQLHYCILIIVLFIPICCFLSQGIKYAPITCWIPILGPKLTWLRKCCREVEAEVSSNIFGPSTISLQFVLVVPGSRGS